MTPTWTRRDVYLFPYDAQETARHWALDVANGLNGGSTPRGDTLLASV